VNSYHVCIIMLPLELMLKSVFLKTDFNNKQCKTKLVYHAS